MRILVLILVLFLSGCSVQNSNYNSQNQVNIPKEGSYASGTYPSAAALSGSSYTQAVADKKCAEAWAYFKQELLQPSGAVSRTDDNTVVSEGQSYGMMLAVQNNDQAAFDKIGLWTKTHMQDTNPYGLFSWQTDSSGEVLSYEPAPDGEEMIAMALYFASHRWGNKAAPYDYSVQAKKILDNILKYEMTSDYYLTFNVSDKNIFNLSYYMPAFYRLFAIYTSDNIWNTVAKNGYDLIDRSKNAATGLVPDWSNKDGSLQSTGRDFYYDAMRVPFQVALDAVWFGATEPRAKTYLDKIIGFFGPQYDTFGNRYSLGGTKTRDDHVVSWIGSFAGSAMGGSSNTDKVNFFNHLMAQPLPTGQYRYYEICWLNFGLLMASGNFRIY